MVCILLKSVLWTSCSMLIQRGMGPGTRDQNNEALSHFSCSSKLLFTKMQQNSICFISTCYLFIFFLTTCFAPDARLSVVMLHNLDKMGELWAGSTVLWVTTAFAAHQETWSDITSRTIMAAHFLLSVFLLVVVALSSTWRSLWLPSGSLAQRLSQELSLNIGHVFVHNPPGDNPKFLTYDCKD